MATKTAIFPAFRVEPNVKAALAVLAQQTPGDVVDQVRFAARRHIEEQISQLERRAAAAELMGGVDAEAHLRLQALRDAYAGETDDSDDPDALN